jgi:hypothetical protein
MSNIKTDGHIIFGMSRIPTYTRLQDLDIEYFLEDHKRQRLENKITDSIEFIPKIFTEKSLYKIAEEGDMNSLVKYVKSVLYKLFPDKCLADNLFNRKIDYKDVFGFGDLRPYEYAVGFLPYDAGDDKEFSYNIEPYKVTDNAMFLKISWDEQFNYLTPSLNAISSIKQFASELFYALDESPFFHTAFKVIEKLSYVNITDEF